MENKSITNNHSTSLGQSDLSNNKTHKEVSRPEKTTKISIGQLGLPDWFENISYQEKLEYLRDFSKGDWNTIPDEDLEMVIDINLLESSKKNKIQITKFKGIRIKNGLGGSFPYSEGKVNAKNIIYINCLEKTIAFKKLPITKLEVDNLEFKESKKGLSSESILEYVCKR